MKKIIVGHMPSKVTDQVWRLLSLIRVCVHMKKSLGAKLYILYEERTDKAGQMSSLITGQMPSLITDQMPSLITDQMPSLIRVLDGCSYHVVGLSCSS